MTNTDSFIYLVTLLALQRGCVMRQWDGEWILFDPDDWRSEGSHVPGNIVTKFQAQKLIAMQEGTWYYVGTHLA
jgi:hypothetical protein